QDRAIPSRLLLWYEPQPRAEVASLREACTIADRRHHGTRDDRADPRHCHHPLASLILLHERFDVSRHRCSALVQSPPVLDQLGDEIDYSLATTRVYLRSGCRATPCATAPHLAAQ